MKNERKTSEMLLEEINEKLNKLMGILAIQGKKEDEQIKILKSVGFTAKEVGVYTGLKVSTVKMRKSWKEK